MLTMGFTLARISHQLTVEARHQPATTHLIHPGRIHHHNGHLLSDVNKHSSHYSEELQEVDVPGSAALIVAS